MANHRADGRATVRKHRAIGGTHRDATLPAGVVKVSVLGALATATIAAPLAAAAAGVDEDMPQSASQASEAGSRGQGDSAKQAGPAAEAPPVALPVAEAAGSAQQAAAETRADEDSASRSEERTAPAEEDAASEEPAEDLGIEVELPEPEPAVSESSAGTAGSSGYVRPVSGPITSGFGGRMHPVLGYFKGHDGVDFGASCGTPVHAAKGGTVVAVEYHHASGNRVKIDHGNGVITGYYHLQGFNTSVGATVEAGEVVGYVGTTGRSTGCHLHFAKMDEAGNYSNPMSLLQ
ncbi:M23 family metallopeptidase [Brachybacterium sp. GCM10030267]|uniref:M23 family metallopeptidase n=1 Tax=Brachybacterium sp. GCM10030267 TaxID=3273381 RepID=UPI003622296D